MCENRVRNVLFVLLSRNSCCWRVWVLSVNALVVKAVSWPAVRVWGISMFSGHHRQSWHTVEGAALSLPLTECSMFTNFKSLNGDLNCHCAKTHTSLDRQVVISGGEMLLYKYFYILLLYVSSMKIVKSHLIALFIEKQCSQPSLNIFTLKANVT